MEQEIARDACRELDRLIDQLHKRGRLRVWSIIFTIFGDAVEPRGGVLSASCLSVLLDRLRIEPGAVRAALSRLAAEGWIERTRRGRNSFYAMSAAGRQRLDVAIRRVYAGGDPGWTGRWIACVPPSEERKQRDIRREALAKEGFIGIENAFFVRAETSEEIDFEKGMPTEIQDCLLFSGEAIDTEKMRLALNGDPGVAIARQAYADHLTRFGPIETSVTSDARPSPLDAMAARILLIHDFRRAVLKDPGLPSDVLGKNWTGPSARQLTGRLYKKLLEPSEIWLDRCNGGLDGPLPQPNPALMQRFE